MRVTISHWLGVALAASLALGTAGAAEPVKIRVGWAVVPANMAPLMATKPDLVHHEGKSYALELTHFTGTPQQLAGFAAGEIDLCSMSYSTLAIAVENAGLTDARIVADILEDGAHGTYSNEYMVLKDAPIHAIEDLKGKVFATTGAGGSSDIAVRASLRRHGMDDKTAMTYVEVGFPNMKSMLLSKKADLIIAVPPFAMDTELRASSRDLFTMADALGPTELLMMVGHADFLAKNHAAVVDFLEDLQRVVRWFSDPANHDETVAIVAAFTHRPPELYQSWLFTKTGDSYRDPDGIPDIAGVQRSIDTQAEMGFLKTTLDVKPYVDLSLMKEAAARLPH